MRKEQKFNRILYSSLNEYLKNFDSFYQLVVEKLISQVDDFNIEQNRIVIHISYLHWILYIKKK